MTNKPTTGSIRDIAIDKVSDYVADAAIKQHQRNISTLYIMPDGRMYWSEEPSTNSWDVIAGTVKPVASIYQCGCGSFKCNCEACMDGDDPEDWAGSCDGVDSLRDEMEANIQRIDPGYFDDEEQIVF